MSSGNSDAWLWVGLAVLGYYAAGTVHKQLEGIRKDSEITHHEKPPDVLGPGTVNALKLDTLSQLTHSPNPDIRAASIKVIIERLFHEESTWSLLRQDLEGLNTERRDKSLMTLRSIASLSDDCRVSNLFRRAHTYESLIMCLMNLLPQARIAETNSTYRSQAEHDSIWLLCYLLPPYHPNVAMKADLIGRWLSMYPFGGQGSTLAEKRTILRSIAMGEYVYKDREFGSHMRNGLALCLKSHHVCRQLQRHGLYETREDTDENVDTMLEFNSRNMPPDLQAGWERIPEGAVRNSNGWTTRSEEFPDETDSEEYWHESIPEGAIRTREGYIVRANARGTEQSPEEQRLRRRRREAIVLGENGRPIQQQDIIQRGTMNLDGNINDEDLGPMMVHDIDDEDLEPLMEQIARRRDEETLAELRVENDRSWWGWLRRLRPDGLAPIHS